MPQYYPNQDVICWVKAFITEAYEGALDEEQKADLRKDFYKVIRGWHTESFIYDWAWNMIAVPFGIEDQFPETFVSALRNSWMASVDDHKDNPKQFSDELKDMFDEDATERNCPECEEWFEPEKDWDDDCCPRCREEDDEEPCGCGNCERCLADDTCVARCGDRGTVTVTDQNGKECLVCRDCRDWFKKTEGYMAEQKAFEAEAEEAEKKVNLTVGA